MIVYVDSLSFNTYFTMDLLEESIIIYLWEFFQCKFYDFIKERDKYIRSWMTITRSLLPSTRWLQQPHASRANRTRARTRVAKRRLYSKRWHLWARMAFALERADRFIKHLSRDSLIITNQLNWVVGAQCVNERRYREDIPIGIMYLWVHATASRRIQGDKGVTRGGTRRTHIHVG